MIVKDLQDVYRDELYIYHLIDQLFYGYITEIPEKLLDKEVIELAANYDSGMEYAWIEVYV